MYKRILVGSIVKSPMSQDNADVLNTKILESGAQRVHIVRVLLVTGYPVKQQQCVLMTTLSGPLRRSSQHRWLMNRQTTQ